jgi:hypothetical protein
MCTVAFDRRNTYGGTEPMKLTRKEQQRRSQIIKELSALSHNGWSNARAVDYRPLEKELAAFAIKACS